MKITLFNLENLIKRSKNTTLIVSADNDAIKNLFSICEKNKLHNVLVTSADFSLLGKSVDVYGQKYIVQNFFEIISKCKNAIYCCAKSDIILDQIRYDAKTYEDLEVVFVEYLLQYNEEKNTHSIKCDLSYKKETIPKIIHYFWTGGNPMPEKYLQCIESWKKYCPDYEIREWNENNYDISKNKYMLGAYENKKWGFVPDYARLDIVYNHGGIYLDTDVEIVKPLDELLDLDAFIGFESRYYVNAGSGFGAKKHNPVIKKMMDIYEDASFVNPDGSLNMIASPSYQTEVLESLGLKRNGQYQKLAGIDVFPANYFSPKSFYTGINWRDDETFSVHHYDATWVKGKTQNETMKRHDEYREYLKGYSVNKIADKEEELISIIIPVYNVEKYLDKCVNSVLNQTYKNIQIILVDDGSTDGCGELCDKYAREHNNVDCVHKINGGLVSARKAGLEVAKGKYALCIDSDDYIDKGMVAFLHKKALESNADVVFSNMIVENEIYGTTTLMKSSIPVGVYDMSDPTNKVYKQFYVDDAGIGIMHGICGKLIRTNLYKKYQDLVPDSIHCGEDAACMYPLLTEAKVVDISGGAFYHYIKREGSILMNTHRDILENWEKLYNYLLDNVHIRDNDTNELAKTNLKKFINTRVMLGVKNMLGINNETVGNVVVDSQKKMWQVPFELIKKKSKIVLWGAGLVGESYYKQLENSKYCNCVAWVDSNVKDNPLVVSIDRLKDIKFDNVLIAVAKPQAVDQITNTLVEKFGEGIKDKIIWQRPVRFFV